MKENFADNVELTITGSGAEMEGVARLDGMAVFVPGALPGERVRAHITKRAAKFARAELDEVLEASPDRCTPECPHAGQCGGCTLMHMNYQATLKSKAQHIRDCITRIGGADDVLRAMHGMEKPYAYRNRVQFPVGGKAGAPKVGFYKGNTHDVIDLPDGCMLLKPELNHARVRPGAHRGMRQQSCALRRTHSSRNCAARGISRKPNRRTDGDHRSKRF